MADIIVYTITALLAIWCFFTGIRELEYNERRFGFALILLGLSIAIVAFIPA